ncbi:MAG TPA: hypothetical protein VGF96_08200 [Terracidiphilus sp.]|jgi:hypothetical protein
MGETADYFKREKYITRRLSLLILGGTLILVPITLASGHGRIPVGVLEGMILAYVVFVAFAVVLIVRGAYARFPKSGSTYDWTLDKATRQKLVRRIRLLQFFVAVYAFGLLNALVHVRRSSWLTTAIGAAISLLFEIVLVKAILRLKNKLRAASIMQAIGVASQPE